MNIIEELRIPANELYQRTGKKPRHVFVPRWRKQELMDKVHSLFPVMYPCVIPPLVTCDFELAGLNGHWWDRDYIEYRT